MNIHSPCNRLLYTRRVEEATEQIICICQYKEESGNVWMCQMQCRPVYILPMFWELLHTSNALKIIFVLNITLSYSPLDEPKPGRSRTAILVNRLNRWHFCKNWDILKPIVQILIALFILGGCPLGNIFSRPSNHSTPYFQPIFMPFPYKLSTITLKTWKWGMCLKMNSWFLEFVPL